jgi:opacity protein-like surface antigen
MMGVRAGWTFYRNDAFESAIEGRIMSTFNADDFDTTVYNVFVKPEYWITPEIGVYGLVGYGYTRWNAGEESIHKSGFAGGLGAEYQFTKNVSVSADWVTNVWDKKVGSIDNINQDVVTLWVNYKF